MTLRESRSSSPHRRVGSAGATEQQAREAGLDVETVEYDLSPR
ncbi:MULTISPECIES: hypothetical protein [unclassified Streptomyces]